jgi:hypothetical protein
MLVAPTACTGGDLSVSDLEQRAETVNDCCTIEKSNIGKENHLVRLGSQVVLVHDWVKRDGKFTGFSMTVSNGASKSYLVKAGSDTYNSAKESFDRSEPIVYVNFCGGCDNPDGCDGGGGGGGDGGGGGGGEPNCPGGDGCPDDGDGIDIY